MQGYGTWQEYAQVKAEHLVSACLPRTSPHLPALACRTCVCDLHPTHAHICHCAFTCLLQKVLRLVPQSL